MLLGVGFLAASAAAQVQSERFTGTTFFGGYGRGLANVGDVDGDGGDDFLVSEPKANLSGGRTSAGRVELVSGATNLVIRTHDGLVRHDELGGAVVGLGDVDFDGVPDYAIAAPAKDIALVQQAGQVSAFSGATGIRLWTVNGANQQERFGAEMVAISDMDGDGRPDLLVRSIETTVVTGAGVKLMVLNTLGLQANSIGRAGDLDGDGLDEILVGVSTYSGTFPGEGLVLVFSGATGQQINRFTGNRTDAGIGWRELGIDDVDGDGVREILVSGTLQTGGPGTYDGIIEVRSGATLAPLATLLGGSGDFLGMSLAAVGDWNRDGITDWIAGVSGGGVYGSARIHSGATSTLLHEIVGEHQQPHEHAHAFGEPVAGGDWNGDGIGDVAIGATAWHDADFQYEGAAYTYLGCPAFSQSYGAGWPGTLGTPGLSASNDPVVGQAITITATNSLGATTPGILLVGLDDASLVLPSGATVLVDQPMILPVSIPATGLNVAGTLPDDPAFYFLDLFLQTVELDPGAVGGLSMTQGLQLRCGFDL